MSIDEIFSQLSTHLVGGLMVHDQLCNYFKFLSLSGYAIEQEEQYESESRTYRRVNSFYIYRYNKLINESGVENPKVIPSDWYKYSRFDVDKLTKRNAVEKGFTEWKKWETATKSKYEVFYKELYDLNEIASAEMVKELIIEVDDELKRIDDRLLELKSVDYDLTYIQEQQCDLFVKHIT